MKRFLTVFTLVLALCAALCLTASAADYEAVAQELSAIGMFRGTGDSFELDREPTRGEAAIMLVRLYGAEEQAQADYAAGVISHPFTDVPDWSAPHVAWLYTNGLTKGMSADTFGASAVCTDQNYATFLLRALGWQDGVDFAYENALAFAQEQGFYDPAVFSGPFLRDDLAALTYQALAADTKDGGYLLARLIAGGAIDPAAAAPMTEKMEVWRACMAIEPAAENRDIQALDTTISADYTLTFTIEGQTFEQPFSLVQDSIVKLDEDQPQVHSRASSVSQGMVTTSNIWLKDGWTYVNLLLGEYPVTQVKYPTQAEELALAELDFQGIELGHLASYKTVSAMEMGENTLYTFVMYGHLAGADSGYLDLIYSAILEGTEENSEISNIRFGDTTLMITVNEDGLAVDEALILTISMDVTVEVEGVTYVVPATMDYTILGTTNAMGKDVKIDYPDFTDFIEIDPAALEE